LRRRCFALLVSLILAGWRLGEKEALIAGVEQRSAQSPQPPADDGRAALKITTSRMCGRRVVLSAAGASPRRAAEGASREPGYWLVTPSR
jgi:cytochrome oxidase assembly protein ShyY1